MAWDMSNIWVMWIVYVALIVGGLAHVFPQLLGFLSKKTPLGKKGVRGLQIAIGIVLVLSFFMLWNSY